MLIGFFRSKTLVLQFKKRPISLSLVLQVATGRENIEAPEAILRVVCLHLDIGMFTLVLFRADSTTLTAQDPWLDFFALGASDVQYSCAAVIAHRDYPQSNLEILVSIRYIHIPFRVNVPLFLSKKLHGSRQQNLKAALSILISESLSSLSCRSHHRH